MLNRTHMCRDAQPWPMWYTILNLSHNLEQVCSFNLSLLILIILHLYESVTNFIDSCFFNFDHNGWRFRDRAANWLVGGLTLRLFNVISVQSKTCFIGWLVASNFILSVSVWFCLCGLAMDCWTVHLTGDGIGSSITVIHHMNKWVWKIDKIVY